MRLQNLGYAITAHRAQSATVDTAHVITGPGMAREHLYVAMTRGRYANHAYVPLDNHRNLDLDEAHHGGAAGPAPTTGREVLERILASTAAEPSATEQLTPPYAATTSVGASSTGPRSVACLDALPGP